MATLRQDRGRYCIQSVDNALNVLEMLSEFDQDVHVTGLSERLGLNKSTVFRLLATFQRRGYVVQDQGTQLYRLGLSAFETGQKLLSRMELLDKARPVMAQLLRQHNESVYLAVRRNHELLFLDMLDTTQQVKAVSFVGQRVPLADSAAGKLFLALQPPGGLRRDRTQRPVTDEELAAIRKAGYCLNQENFAQGITALAVPLFDHSECMAAALVLLGPDFRIGEERANKELLPPLVDAAETISSRLGYQRRRSLA